MERNENEWERMTMQKYKWNVYTMERNINSVKEAKNKMLIKNAWSYMKSKGENKDRYSL